MEHFLVKLIINAVAVFITAYLLSGIKVKSFGSAIIIALVLALVNAILKPVFIFLTIPLTIVTLGLFLFVIDAIMILIVNKIIPGFEVKNFWWALGFSIVLSIINSILVWLL